MVEEPEKALAAVAAQAAADVEAGLSVDPRMGSAGVPGSPGITPEMVLAAEKLVGRRKPKWPNYRQIFTRVALLGILLGSIAAAILATYFLTKEYGR
eukprot:365291-Chlamydomonas_euryale.AAC.7